MDTYYRQYHLAFGKSLTVGNDHLDDLFKQVTDKVEGLYTHWFLGELGNNWSDACADELAKYGRIMEIPQQEDFYNQKVKSEDNRVFVIISDALRYEVAASLAEQLRRETQSKVALGSCEGIFPTVTKFGMAALLPHKQLTINERSNGGLQILADGMSTDAGNRDKVIKAANSNSVALKYKDIAPMKRAERSALVKGMDVVYIYHDKVDEASHTSDSMVFPACDDAIEEIKNIVRIIRNEFSGTRVYITADHGFLYTYSPLSEDSKVDKTTPSEQDVEIDRRYLITRKGVTPDYLLPVKFMDDGYDAFAPRESVRIKKKGGGLNFVHGGISLQEMVVPVIEYHYLRNDSKAYQRNKIVRKDLTKKIKEGANVPVYVLEFLLGQYCSSDDEEVIEQGVQNVKRILADNFVRPDEAQKILSRLRSRGSHTVIDMITVNLNMRDNIYQADFSNLGIRGIPIADEYPEKYDRLLCGGIWCIVQLNYEYVEEEKKNGTPIRITKLTPIQMPHIDIEDLKQGRQAFTKEEWLDVMLRSIGMEPDELSYREKWLLLTRMIPLVENNFNLCELGPRSTGKSHLYKEISPNSILVSGGQTTVANLFYNMGRKTVGLVGLWDCVAFDEVAGIKFKDKDGVQIMKDYMASGSFARGKEEKAASASMVFVGNINQSVDVLLKTSSLFDPFPPEMGTDTAFLDRIHCYLPGWEIPKFRPEHFTND